MNKNAEITAEFLASKAAEYAALEAAADAALDAVDALLGVYAQEEECFFEVIVDDGDPRVEKNIPVSKVLELINKGARVATLSYKNIIGKWVEVDPTDPLKYEYYEAVTAVNGAVKFHPKISKAEIEELRTMPGVGIIAKDKIPFLGKK